MIVIRWLARHSVTVALLLIAVMAVATGARWFVVAVALVTVVAAEAAERIDP